MHVLDLPPDVHCQHILKYFTVADCWAISRTCKEMYAHMNKEIFGLFKKHFNSDERSEQIEIVNYFISITPPPRYVFTGSSVWSTLLGVRWVGQDIDVFVECSPMGMSDIRHKREIFIKGKRYFSTGCRRIPELFYGECLYIVQGGPLFTKIADIVWCKNNSIENVLDNFDIVGCGCYFDDKVLFIPNPSDTLLKVSVAKKQPNTSEEVFKNRLIKYRQRGIKILQI